MRLNWVSLRKSLLVLSVLSFLITTSTFGQVNPRVVEAVDNARRITLAGNVHPLARAEFDRGAVADAQPMTRILLLLKRSDEQEAALQDALEKQQDKSSPSYHQWLTPEAFGALYGPTDTDIHAVTQWLSSQGFTIEKVYSGKTVIEFSGNAGQVQAAFGAAIRNYEVEGKTYTANANDPQIPAALAPVVSGIVSLNNFPRQSHVRYLGAFRRTAGKPGLQPLFTFPRPNGTGDFYGLGPGDFATIYNSKTLISGGNDGTGQTIAIVGETQINPQDVMNFRTMFGLPANFTAANIILNGEDPGITSTGEESEADLDTQWSGAAAPGATIKYVVSASTPASSGVDLSALYIIEHNLADVMSESYGNCEKNLGTTGNAFFNSLWQQAAAQGMTVMVSSGDGGSAGCDNFDTQQTATRGLAVSGLAGTPFNVSVGGTDFDQRTEPTLYWNATNDAATGTSAEGYIPEIPWNENCAQISLTGCGASAPNGSLNIVAGSGGPSNLYGKPTWQMGVNGMPNDNHRDQPDVSLFASPGFNDTGYVICQQDRNGNGLPTCDLNTTNGYLDFHVVGGTSASAPAFAGVMALVNEYQAKHGGSSRQGNPNHTLYALAKKSGASCTSSTTEAAGCVFNDVVKGNSYIAAHYGSSVGTNSVPCQGGTLNCSVAGTSSTGVLVDPAHTTTEAWTAGTGYDLATGLGSVNVNNLATNWGTASTMKTTTTLTLSPTTGITHGTGENVTVNITVTPTSGTATGDVSLIAKFADGTTQGLDQFTLASSKVANATTKSLPGGTNYTVTAHYAGDGTNAPSDSPPVTVTVAPETSQTFIVIPTFDSSGNQTNGNATSVVYGSNYIIRMYVTDKNGAANTYGPPTGVCYLNNPLTCPTGTVTLTDNGTPVDTGGGGAGIYNLNGEGYTRDLNPSIALFTGGTHHLAASYSGDSSYQKSASATTTFAVTPEATQTQMDSYPTRPLPGQIFQLEANVTSQLTGRGVGTAAYPGGTVTFYDGSTALPGTVQITQGNTGQIYADIYNISFSSPGPHTITAQYSGDNNYAPSTTSPVTVTVLIPTSMTLSVSATNINYGQNITVTVVMTSSSKGPPITSQVFFQSDYGAFNTTTTTPGTDANGNQMLTVTGTGTPQGTELVSAIYQGDANYGPSSTNPVTINVNIPDFTLGPAAGITAVPVAGQTSSAQITITPLSQTPSTVNLQYLNPFPPIPGYSIALTPQQVSLNGSPVTATLTLTPNNSATGTAAKSQARHAGFLPLKQGEWLPLGIIAGFWACFLWYLPKRRKRYRAAFGLTVTSLLLIILGCGGGGGGSLPPPPPPQAQPTTITVATSNAKDPENAPFTITATVTGTKAPTGTVEFYNFGTMIDSETLTGNQAQMTHGISTSYPGLFQITAKYLGDSNNLPSTTTTPITQVITGTFPVTITGSTGRDIHIVQATIGLQ